MIAGPRNRPEHPERLDAAEDADQHEQERQPRRAADHVRTHGVVGDRQHNQAEDKMNTAPTIAPL